VERRQRIGVGLDLQLDADPERSQREPEPRALQEVVHPRTPLPLELARVRAFNPDRDVGE
jgi:hypothetical protein